MASRTGKAGVIVAPDNANSLEQLSHAVLDDVLYNIVHDILIKVHRDEKIARQNTAAIRVEKLAQEASDSHEVRPDVRVENEAAIYEDGMVVLKGNPLKTTQEVLCNRCHLPRLLHPTEGKGARKPDPSVIYCKKHPYIDKPGFDIYGQTWVAPGPGRGKKKKDMEKKLDGNSDSPGGTPGGDSMMGTSAKDRPANVLSFPSATCNKCKRCILVSRLNNHMGSCIGNSGRNASRAAAQKIQNGGNSNSGSQRDEKSPAPAGSQKGTPLPGSRAGSPRKRDVDEFDDDGGTLVDDPDSLNPKKKKLKASVTSTPTLKKVILKTKATKKEKVKGSSQLSQEQKAEDIKPGGTKKKKPAIETAAKNNLKQSPAKKLKLNSKPNLSSPMSKNGADPDGESESSGTLSSPPQ